MGLAMISYFQFFLLLNNMSEYKKKYEYMKLKYTSFKLQKGGNNMKMANISETNKNQISELLQKFSQNFGQNNCGIVFFDNYVIKCVETFENIPLNTNIKDHHELLIIELSKKIPNFFPTYYLWPDGKIYNYIPINDKLYAKCIIMEKLDGDLTTYIINRAYYETFGNYDDFNFFYDRLPKTTIDYIRTSDDDIKKFNNIISQIKPNLLNICYELQRKLTLLHHDLISKGWEYGDLKLDNVGYKGLNGNIELYFIDIESGLAKISTTLGHIEYLNFIHSLTRTVLDYGIYGQYNLRYIFKIGDSDIFTKSSETANSFLEIIYKLLEKNNCRITEIDNYNNWFKCVKIGTNYNIVVQYVNGFYRLVIFDDNLKHMSNDTYNTMFPKIDMLYDSIIDLCNQIFLLE